MSKLSVLEKMLSKGEITRRDFLTRVSALGLTAMVSSALLSNPAVAATPKKGGRLRIGCGGGHITETLDPATINDAMASNISMQLRNNLVEIDHDFKVIPELAESWESTNETTKWTFKLRKGIEFHNGKTLDADDVLFSLNYHRGEKSKSAVKGSLKPIKEIKADGKNVIRFTLDQGNIDFPYILSDRRIPIIPAGTSNFNKGIGTGGYMLVSYEPGFKTLTKRNPNYWKEGRAHFDEVETIGIADLVSRVNALKSNQVDYINRCDFKLARLLDKTPDINLIRVTGLEHKTFPMLTGIFPFDNNDVRMALKYAINREELVKIVFMGFATIGNDHPISPTMRFHASELPQRAYDPDKAKFHIKKAGLEGYKFRLHTGTAPNPGPDMAYLYKEHAAKAGIDIHVQVEPADGYWSEIWNKKPWVQAAWYGRPTEDMMLTQGYSENAPWNDSHWKHPRFNELLNMARVEFDETKRHEMYIEMQRLIRDEGGVVVPVFSDFLEAGTNKLKFDNLAGDLEMDGMRCAERWWFES